MSITINGATNTLTAASGVTIAGNVAATALNSTPIGGTTPAAGAFTTLSSTGTLGVGGAAAAWYIAGAASIGGWIDIGNGAGTATGSILSNAYAAGVADWRSRQGAFGSLRFDLNPDLQTFSWFTAPTVAINTALTWTQRMSLSTTGLAVTGLLDLSAASSGQIKFPATQNASADANTLDDYEEGTWTPALSAATTTTYSAQTGTYTKIGRVVTVNFLIGITSIGDGSQTTVTGLPFSVFATNRGAGGTAYVVSPATAFASILPHASPSSTSIQFVAATTAGVWSDGAAVFQNGTTFSGTVTYFV